MSQVTLLTGPERRRRWSLAERETILAEAFGPGGVVADVARRFDIATSLIYRWRRDVLGGSTAKFSPVVMTQPAQRGEPGDAAIIVALGEAQVQIRGAASSAQITATLKALR